MTSKHLSIFLAAGLKLASVLLWLLEPALRRRQTDPHLKCEKQGHVPESETSKEHLPHLKCERQGHVPEGKTSQEHLPQGGTDKGDRENIRSGGNSRSPAQDETNQRGDP